MVAGVTLTELVDHMNIGTIYFTQRYQVPLEL